MQTLTIKIKDDHVLKLLEDLEAMNLLQVITKSVLNGNASKLSRKIAGSITTKDAETMRNEIKEMRGEWERDF